ncbi:hypothetical protein [Chryseobacterium sp. Leaf201]|uniref:hypothetical protein n=1 Tax=Chryseobacterium sp. Leaf201 TaxID=1735672 RepID=UPI0006FA21F5|nr:hypothetical protein [Chryseobacterium sp. Leaf201]KQM62842.1 hypothetical protein ASE55_00170 [Chryseobacterium sp. Leaf201]
MRNIIFFLMFSLSLVAQKVDYINLDQNIKDKRGLTKSLTLIDTRETGEIGILSPKGQPIEVKLANENLKDHIENWFNRDNKDRGSNDIVLMLEDLKIYNEQDEGEKHPYAKARLKISSFIKRNDRYYFINRFDNVIVSDPKRTVSAPNYLALQISDIITEFIKTSYLSSVSGNSIPENEIRNYDNYLKKNYSAFNLELKDGVYKSFRHFYYQEPDTGYFADKDKKGNVTGIKNTEGQSAALSDMYCYVDSGKAYRVTPSGFAEMHKDAKGFYIVSSRKKLLSNSNTSDGIIIGAIAAGGIGALVGGIIHSELNKGNVNGFGYRSPTEMNIYIDALSGAYVFEK